MRLFKKEFVGPLIPLLWTSSDFSSGFQSQSGQSYSHLAEAWVLQWCSLIFTSGVTPADLLAVSMTAVANIFHVPASRHWWSSKPEPIVPQTKSEVNLHLHTLIGRLCKYFFIGSEPSVMFPQSNPASQTVHHHDVITSCCLVTLR